MTYTKALVCFANSRKTSGRCVAGKEWANGTPGEWLRPVSSRPSHEVSLEERRYQNGSDPQLLDIVAVPCVGHQPLPHQVENHVLDGGYFWTRQGTLAWAEINNWLDNPASLWTTGQSSYAFQNNRVAEGYQGGTSLYLIAVDKLQIIVGAKSAEYPKRIVRGEFAYRGASYRMAVTDPVVEQHYLGSNDGLHSILKPVICVSLGDPFQGYFYKLIAAVLYKERFE